MDRIIAKIIEVGRALHREGLVDSHSGNISYKFGRYLFITRKNAMLGSIRKEDIIRLEIGKRFHLKDRASSEIDVHLHIIEKTGKRAVVHAHPPHTVALSLSKERVEPIDWEGKEIVGNIPVVNIEKPSASSELASVLGDTLKKVPVVIVRGHGVFSSADDLFEAYKFISVLEHSCRIIALEANNGKAS